MADKGAGLRRKQGRDEATSGECGREEVDGLGHIRRLDSTSISQSILSTEKEV